MKKKMSILAVLVLTVILSTGSVAGTYAKYTSAIDYADEARVAKWGITMSDSTTDDPFFVGLFQNEYTSVDGVNSDVKGENGEKVIAPGTTGEYTFRVGGTAPETNYTVEIRISDITDAFANLEYKPVVYWLDDDDQLGITYDTIEGLADAIAKLYTDASGDPIVYAAGTAPTRAHTIHWAWAFDDELGDITGQDAKDTAYGNDAADAVNIALGDIKKIGFKVTVVANQTEKAATA